MRAFLLLCIVVLACSGCSQNRLLTGQDYEKSRQDFVLGDLHEAALDFPRGKEDGDFITTMERGYLSLAQGEPDIKGLQKQAEALENRVRYHVSREARTFFYVQTPEDYYASEHEVIWLHFLLSWGYSLQGKYEDACVEAREAGSLLSLPWSPAGHFDDPAMRLMLASLWTMCGKWSEARVDLRAAWVMDNSLAWAKALAERDKPPAQLFVVLGGPGPEPVWNPEMSANPMRSERHVGFTLRGQKSLLTISDRRGRRFEAHLSPDASKWYERHIARESELHELILDSAYGGQAAASGAWAGTKIAAFAGAGLALGLGGTALGAAIIYYSHSLDAIEGGVLIAAASIGKGAAISKKGYRESATTLKRDLDPSMRYRFVRYLPEYLWLGWSDRRIAYPVELRTATARAVVGRPSVSNQAAVSIAWLPDAGFSTQMNAGSKPVEQVATSSPR